VFHDRAAATGNARSPRLDRLVAGTNRVDVEPDRRRRHANRASSTLFATHTQSNEAKSSLTVQLVDVIDSVT